MLNVVYAVHSSLSPWIPSVHRGSICKEVRSRHPEHKLPLVLLAFHLLSLRWTTVYRRYDIPFSIKFCCCCVWSWRVQRNEVVTKSYLLKGHFDQNPANPKFDLYYSKRKIGIQLADFPKVTPFTRKTPEIPRVEDAKNARPPCWPWIQSSGQRFHAVTSSYQHDAASHSFLCKMSSSESDLSSSISSESSFLSIHDPLGDVEKVDSSVGGSTTVFDDSFEGCCGRRTSSKL